jgi:predicted RNA binding protein YcfA (HicA-like mRNA interferase family)
MKLPRDLSGEDLIKHLCKYWEYQRVHQVGSHVILQTEQPGHIEWRFRPILLCELER